MPETGTSWHKLGLILHSCAHLGSKPDTWQASSTFLENSVTVCMFCIGFSKLLCDFKSGHLSAPQGLHLDMNRTLMPVKRDEFHVKWPYMSTSPGQQLSSFLQNLMPRGFVIYSLVSGSRCYRYHTCPFVSFLESPGTLEVWEVEWELWGITSDVQDEYMTPHTRSSSPRTHSGASVSILFL